ncbi:hypothetical protein LSAT2_004756 [Lamellibrachia satsuma]|nr:hypothetical protein LSAT2_004756 [Lamellibrachia satsuma]
MFLFVAVGCVPVPDCSQCDYTNGLIWLPDPQDCHMYYICEQVDMVWTYYHASCGFMYWDQSRFTCTDMIQQEPDHDDKTDGPLFQPPTPEVDPNCSDDLLLHFPYDVDFNDVTCHHAKGYTYGDGQATIVNDAERGRVVHFDGNVRIEVPFMRDWFRDECMTEFTVMLWFKRARGSFGRVGLVHNGDCMYQPTFIIEGDENNRGQNVFGGLDTDCSWLKFTRSIRVRAGKWHHVALVYNGARMKFYVDKRFRNRKALSGSIDKLQNPMMIGAVGCPMGPMGFFRGCIDEVRVYTRALSRAEVAAAATA